MSNFGLGCADTIVGMSHHVFDDHEAELHDLGLRHDLGVLASIARSSVTRRVALRLFGGLGLAVLAACGSKSSDAKKATSGASAEAATTTGASTTSGAASTTVATAAPSTTTTTLVADDGPGGPPPGQAGAPPPGPRDGRGGPGGGGGSQPADGTIPQETGGPFPGDGTNGPNALSQSGIVRRDVTTSLGSGTKATGVPLTVKMKLTKGTSGAPLAGAAAYIWHCDQQGRYSMYSAGVTNETYLRGVQAADADGEVTFTTIYPGAYSGRWPHIHFEVFESLAAASSGAAPISTSQLALTETSANAVYATKGYEASVGNMKRTTLRNDMVFADGVDRQTPSFTGDAATGFTAVLNVPVAS
jgi:protocatechuate 3,4-dioxygenase beta subunit